MNDLRIEAMHRIAVNEAQTPLEIACTKDQFHNALKLTFSTYPVPSEKTIEKSFAIMNFKINDLIKNSSAHCLNAKFPHLRLNSIKQKGVFLRLNILSKYILLIFSPLFFIFCSIANKFLPLSRYFLRSS